MTTQITLSESESEALKVLSRSQGKTPEETLHKAIAQFLKQHQSENCLAALHEARGIWQQRQDLPDFALVRSEWDRL